GVGIVYYTTDGVIISHNRKALELIGAQTGDYVGKSIREIFSAEEAEKLIAIIESARVTDCAQQHENQVLFASGPKWFSSISTRVTNTAGEVLGVMIASEDITERKSAESALFESQAILKAAFENSQA